MTTDRLASAARALATELERTGTQLVLAESCTAGLVAGTLAQVPGISRFLCGSFATYRDSAKAQWLNIDPQLIAEHTSVSDEVTNAMAINALKKTPEAHLCVAVTGHLEHGAVDSQSVPLCHIHITKRTSESIRLIHSASKTLTAESRRGRQQQAVAACLSAATDVLTANKVDV